MSVRKWHTNKALSSYTALNEVVNSLTEEEVLHCLRVEASTRRRRSITNRLIMRAVRLRSVELTKQLREQFHATS